MNRPTVNSASTANPQDESASRTSRSGGVSWFVRWCLRIGVVKLQWSQTKYLWLYRVRLLTSFPSDSGLNFRHTEQWYVFSNFIDRVAGALKGFHDVVGQVDSVEFNPDVVTPKDLG